MPCVLLIKVLKSMLQLSVTKLNIVSHSLPVFFRLEMNGFTFMKTALKSRPEFSKKNVTKSLNRFFINEGDLQAETNSTLVGILV